MAQIARLLAAKAGGDGQRWEAGCKLSKLPRLSRLRAELQKPEVVKGIVQRYLSSRADLRALVSCQYLNAIEVLTPFWS